MCGQSNQSSLTLMNLFFEVSKIAFCFYFFGFCGFWSHKLIVEFNCLSTITVNFLVKSIKKLYRINKLSPALLCLLCQPTIIIGGYHVPVCLITSIFFCPPLSPIKMFSYWKWSLFIAFHNKFFRWTSAFP